MTAYMKKAFLLMPIVFTIPALFVMYVSFGVIYWTVKSSLPIKMVDIPGGTFIMGDDNSEFEDEKPAHQVTISPFRMGEYEVTQGQYRQVMGKNPSGNQTHIKLLEWFTNVYPVENVSWLDAVNFCNALSEMEGRGKVYTISDSEDSWKKIVTMDMSADGYRLPTEAEWEYACRAGTTTQWSFGDDDSVIEYYAWVDANTDTSLSDEVDTQHVGTGLPNPWGLYDMHGNVWELCWDMNYNYSSEDQKDPGELTDNSSFNFHMARGGYWNGPSTRARSASRITLIGIWSIGFRVVCKQQ
jgi:formylglycine-generating enzyme required for sulfatase activity